MSSQKEIAAADVVRIILQFLKENGLNQSFHTLQQESQIALNAPENADQYIHNGRWEAVLQVISTLRLPMPKLVELYEHVTLEMIEMHEVDVARAIMRTAEPLQALKQQDPDRLLRLEHLISKGSYEAKEFYPNGDSKEKRRIHLAKNSLAIKEEIISVPPSRLLSLLGQALKFQQYKGHLPPGAQFDLFKGTAPIVLEEEYPPKRLDRTIQFGKKSHAECARFSPDGQYLVSGSVDGFVEVWDFTTGKINKDLQFQADDQFMLHDTAVLCLNFSKDSELLVSGSQDGKIKVWQLKTGKCFRKLEAHTKAVTCVAFTRDAAKILSGSYDQTLRLHGLVSGKTLKIFRGHTGTINEAVFNHDGSFIHSASSDGTVRVWDVKSGDCHGSFKPIQGSAAEVTVNTICWLPRGAAEQLLVCNRSATIYLTNLRGEIVRTYQSGKEKLGMFLYAIASPRGDFVYGVAEDSHVYCFRSETAELVHTVKVSEKEVIGLSHHPHRNLLASWADDGTIQLWKP